MANVYQYLVPTGVIVPDTSAILLDTQNEYKTVFGQDLITTSDTRQGVLITAEALARAAVVNNNAVVANQINPNLSEGIFLDSIGALSGIERTEATKTVVSGVVLTGVASTTISEGTQAQTTDGDVFETLSTVVLDGSGNATVDFASVEYGPIPCAEDTLTQPVSNVLGWETVNNPDAGVLGSNTQADQGFRAFRNNTLAFQAISLIGATISALYYVDGVKSVSYLENVGTTTATIDGISLAAKSIWVCVDGGSDLDIAAALLENKSGGCNWNGAEEVSVIEPTSGQNYITKFDRPEEVPILVRVTTPNGNSANIKATILAWAAGEIDGLAGLTLGADVSPFEISAAIANQYGAYFISKVEITTAAVPLGFSTDTLEIDINQLATIDEAAITVIIA